MGSKNSVDILSVVVCVWPGNQSCSCLSAVRGAQGAAAEFCRDLPGCLQINRSDLSVLVRTGEQSLSHNVLLTQDGSLRRIINYCRAGKLHGMKILQTGGSSVKFCGKFYEQEVFMVCNIIQLLLIGVGQNLVALFLNSIEF